MKMTTTLPAVLAGLLLLVPCTQAARSHSAIGIGTRYHPEHDYLDTVPYSDTFSYGLVYEYHEANALWQLGLQYAPDLGHDDDTVDYALTPELNLLWKDNVWRGGVGILTSYLESDIDSGWSDLYWQFVLGFEFPMGRFRLEILAYYAFTDWDQVDEFQVDDVDAGVFLTYPF